MNADPTDGALAVDDGDLLAHLGCADGAFLTSGAAGTQQAGLGAYALAVLFYGVFRLLVGRL